MRIAIFARYSSKLQDPMSREAQDHACTEYCRQQGWTVVKRYLLDEVSSVDLSRDDRFLDMIASAKRGEFDAILVHKLDRFGRDLDTTPSVSR